MIKVGTLCIIVWPESRWRGHLCTTLGPLEPIYDIDYVSMTTGYRVRLQDGRIRGSFGALLGFRPNDLCPINNPDVSADDSTVRDSHLASVIPSPVTPAVASRQRVKHE